jgi:subtilisin family serine protease
VSPEATFSLYQAVTEDGTLPLEAYSDAISTAIEDDVDILNVSAGDPWRGPIAINPNVPETKRALDAGITVVAAAGNWKPNQEDRPPVHCPAALEDVLAVGGFISECPAAPGDEDATESNGPYYVLKNEGFEYSDRVSENTLCGQIGCVDGSSCITKQSDKPWEYNPQPASGKPDVLAPVHFPHERSNGKRFLGSGSSFAAPIVTGSLACIIDELNRTGNAAVTPFQLRRAVIDGGASMNISAQTKYDAMGTRRALGLVS